jgi:hypothetical protein
MKGFYVSAAFVGLAFASWIGFILINGMRKRIARINQDRRERGSGSGTYR